MQTSFLLLISITAAQATWSAAGSYVKNLPEQATDDPYNPCATETLIYHWNGQGPKTAQFFFGKDGNFTLVDKPLVFYG
jgi:hypothetical protein